MGLSGKSCPGGFTRGDVMESYEYCMIGGEGEGLIREEAVRLMTPPGDAASSKEVTSSEWLWKNKGFSSDLPVCHEPQNKVHLV